MHFNDQVKLHKLYPSKQGLESLLNRTPGNFAPESLLNRISGNCTIYIKDNYVLNGMHTTVATIHKTFKYK